MLTRSQRVVVVAAALWVGLLGFMVGRVAERMWFDERRSAVLRRLEDDTRRVHMRLMQLELERAER